MPPTRKIAEGFTHKFDLDFQTDIHQPGSDPYADHDFWAHKPAFQEVDALVTFVESPDDSPMTSPGEIMRGQQTYMNASVRKMAKTLVELLSHTSPDVLTSGKGVKVRPKRFDPAKGFWIFQAAGSKGENYTIRVKGTITPKIKNLEKAQVQVSCTCNFFMWQGPEHWAKTNAFLYGKPRGTATKPAEKDPKGKNWICKHVAAALEMARRYRFSSHAKEGAERWSYDGEIIAMPDPSRVVALHLASLG